MVPSHIVKRNGALAPFNAQKIYDAMYKANIAVEDEVILPEDLRMLTNAVVSRIPEVEVPNVEQVQDIVEEALIKAGYAKTAKAYALRGAQDKAVKDELMEIRELTTLRQGRRHQRRTPTSTLTRHGHHAKVRL